MTTTLPADPSQLVVCEYCDVVYQRVPLQIGESLRCLRCHAEIGRYRLMDVNALLAVTISALIVFVIANTYPIIKVEFRGTVIDSSLWGMFIHTWQAGYWPLSLLAALMTFFAPLIQLLALTHILIPLHHGERATHFKALMHLLRWMRPWSLIEVFMLGVLVSVVRLHAFTSVIPGIGIFALGVLTLLMAGVGSVNLHRIWSLADEAEPA